MLSWLLGKMRERKVAVYGGTRSEKQERIQTGPRQPEKIERKDKEDRNKTKQNMRSESLGNRYKTRKRNRNQEQD